MLPRPHITIVTCVAYSSIQSPQKGAVMRQRIERNVETPRQAMFVHLDPHTKKQGDGHRTSGKFTPSFSTEGLIFQQFELSKVGKVAGFLEAEEAHNEEIHEPRR
jgi:hypothetical protein